MRPSNNYIETLTPEKLIHSFRQRGCTNDELHRILEVIEYLYTGPEAKRGPAWMAATLREALCKELLPAKSPLPEQPD